MKVLASTNKLGSMHGSIKMQDIQKLMREKVEVLSKASKAYYNDDREVMSNVEYDRLYDELVEIEKETGIILSNSPTSYVGYELSLDLPKEPHDKVMLSLDKTKDKQTIKDWLGSQLGLISWKLDGLTIVLTYSDGILAKAVTRGNGQIGEVITNNARVFANLPVKIPFMGDLVLRGEAIIRYSDFERINSEIPEVTQKYKNPRNLCSGSVRQLNNKITADRSVNFLGFSLVKADGVDFDNSKLIQLKWLNSQGFDIVPYKIVDEKNIIETISWFAEEVPNNDFPSDGLVITFDDIDYSNSLGTTAKFPKDAIAFKWRDEIKETILTQIEWSASRTGLINPIAIFEPVELEGTTVSRASVHNISIMEELELGIGDTIEVYKANMIIPQIADNLTRSGNIHIPENCPVCNVFTEIKQDESVKFLYCPNPNCLAKQIKLFSHFVSRNAMNIDGLSEATIEKLIAKGLIKELSDIFSFKNFKDQVIIMDGFGEKSFNNLAIAIDKARKTSAPRLLYSLGIPNVGITNAKLICKRFKNIWADIENANTLELLEINGVGDVMAEAFVAFFTNEKNKIIVADLIKEIEFVDIESNSKISQNLEGLSFVITGSLEHFANRDALKKAIEDRGGKSTDSVTSKTNYLINNDNLSSSSKNKKAKELGIEVITESEFIQMFELEI